MRQTQQANQWRQFRLKSSLLLAQHLRRGNNWSCRRTNWSSPRTPRRNKWPCPLRTSRQRNQPPPQFAEDPNQIHRRQPTVPTITGQPTPQPSAATITNQPVQQVAIPITNQPTQGFDVAPVTNQSTQQNSAISAPIEGLQNANSQSQIVTGGAPIPTSGRDRSNAPLQVTGDINLHGTVANLEHGTVAAPPLFGTPPPNPFRPVAITDPNALANSDLKMKPGPVGASPPPRLDPFYNGNNFNQTFVPFNGQPNTGSVLGPNDPFQVPSYGNTTDPNRMIRPDPDR